MSEQENGSEDHVKGPPIDLTGRGAPRPRGRGELRPEDLTALIDTREQDPLTITPLNMQSATLTTGDYSLLGLEHEVVVERKSLPDLIACVGRERERFEREVTRLLAYPSRMLVVESTLGAIELGGWRGQVTPNQVTGSILGWVAQGLPVLLVGDHASASRAVARFLFISARRRWRELQSFSANLKLLGDHS